MSTTTIWSNGTDTRDAIMEAARAEAKRLIPDAIANHGTSPDDDWLAAALVEAAIHAIRDQDPWRRNGEPDEAAIIDAIDAIDIWRDHTMCQIVTEYNEWHHQDAIANLDAIPLARPVIIIGRAGLWDGPRTLCSIIHPDTIGDLIRQAPWNGMDVDDWSIDDHDDLRYTGIHHDGTNTCAYRQLKPHAHIHGGETTDRLLHMSEPLGPTIRHHLATPTPDDH